MMPVLAVAQVGGEHILGFGALQPPPPPQVNQAPPPAPAAPHAKVTGSFVLRQVVIEGASSVPAAQLRQSWAPLIGKTVDAAALSAIARSLGAAEAKADIALYTVKFLTTDTAAGVVRISITEASVAHVVIAKSEQHARLGLVEAYTQPILQSRPLKRSVLERYVLLMGDIAGAKVGSSFVPVKNHPDQVQMVLDVKSRKFFGGFTVDNEGTPLLGSTQIVGNAGVNNLFHEGERTQVVVGLPVDIGRYHYFGINDIEPVGSNGITVSLGAGQLVSRPENGSGGNAQVYSVHLNDPILRSVHANVTASIGLDALNSANAFLGFTTSDERTRAVRGSVIYNDDKYFTGIDTAVLSISRGVNILGARRASLAYGGTSFTKGDFTLQRLQVLPEGFALRLSMTGQFTPDRLPPSEEFDYGGTEYGRAFTEAELTGDEGVAALAELAHNLPTAWLPPQLAGTALFVLADYGEVWNRNTIYAPATDHGASFAGGIKFHLLGKIDISVGAATPIVTPRYYGPNQKWRFVLVTAGQF